MSDPTKGGRGQKAPYQTTHYRIPEPIKPVVEQLATAYKRLVANGANTESLLDGVWKAITTGYYPGDKKDYQDKRVTDLDNANWELQKQYTQLNKLWRQSELKRSELQAQLEECRQQKDLGKLLEELRERNEQLISSRYQANQALTEAKREIKELKAQSADAIFARYLDEIGGIPTDERGKPKARYDQLAKFKSWLESQ